ncbi:hypothetical protein H2204_003203 [Knufia peltigerae]|uniref:Xylanolytic transcriptional activator regulatory domain-containing protein n=1 Tax=Knufia peltigerae TaxID=1002370 RepID=A0AA38YB11_9EURO|nr:hypothetical protein H2204_003203 [Knufia peltigerae]
MNHPGLKIYLDDPQNDGPWWRAWVAGPENRTPKKLLDSSTIKKSVVSEGVVEASHSSLVSNLAPVVDPQSTTVTTTKAEEDALPAFGPGADVWINDGTCPATTQDVFLNHTSDLCPTSWEGFTGGPPTVYGDDEVNSSFDLGVIDWDPVLKNTDEWPAPSPLRGVAHSPAAAIDKPKPSSTWKEFPDVTTMAQSSSSTSDGFIIYSYYPFLEMENLPALRPEVTRFLEMSHSFHVPVPEVLDEFVRKYFLYVHPNVPMLDEGDFWEAYSQRNSKPHYRIPLIVFQAMMFAVSSFVSSESLQRLNLWSTREARSRFYEAAKTLYQHNDSNRDPLIMTRAGILLSYHTSPGSMRSNSYWMTLAIHCAREARADDYQCVGNSPERRRTLKRLWWSCILRDRTVSLGVRRPLLITSDDFDFSLPPLTMEDFENDIGRSRVVDTKGQRALIRIVVHRCKLSLALTDLLMLAYPRKAPFVPECEAQVRRCLARLELSRALLENWYRHEAERDLQHIKCTRDNQSPSARMALFNLRLLAIASSRDTTFKKGIIECKTNLEAASKSITKILDELLQRNLLKYLPISIVAYAAFPLVLYTLNKELKCSGATTGNDEADRKDLDVYTKSMEVFSRLYDGTDVVLDSLSTIMGNIKFEEDERTSNKSKYNPQIMMSEKSDESNKTDGDDDQNYDSPSSRQRRSTTHSSQGTHSSSLAKYDWGDVLLLQPSCYLRLALTIDIFLCTGQVPKDAELPSAFQSSQQGTKIPVYQISLQMNHHIGEEAVAAAGQSHHHQRETHLLEDIEQEEIM